MFETVTITNIALATVLTVLCLVFGVTTVLLVQVVPGYLAGMAGVYLFYVQHQFEDVYWEHSDSWSYTEAALEGSSYFELPKVLQFFTGNIGLHHVHHLNARVPNYNLQAAHDENAGLHGVPTLSLLDGLRATRLKLWDEQQAKLVGFRAVRAVR